MAFTDSLGFFDDIPDTLWLERKQISQRRLHHSRPEDVMKDARSPRSWYQNNWDPDFACFAEDKLGDTGDGHKWVCDPHRIEEQSRRGRKCIVYSIGSSGRFGFERAVQERMPSCEIHTFDFFDYSRSIPRDLKIHFHAWGLEPSYDVTLLVDQGFSYNRMAWRDINRGEFKTIAQTMQELGHEGKTIDLFKIDCEGCEWFSYKDWISDSVDIRQILVEAHEVPVNANEFFQDVHDAKFVLFHKEANIQYSGGGCIEFSFLKMSASFFNRRI